MPCEVFGEGAGICCPFAAFPVRFESSCSSGNESGAAVSSAVGISVGRGSCAGAHGLYFTSAVSEGEESQESKSQRHADASGKEVLVAQVVMPCVTKQQNSQEQVFFPRKQVSVRFLKRRWKCQTPRTGKKGAETVKVVWLFAF